MVTGCRPNEAAYVVFNRSIRANNYIVRHMTFSHMATAPASDTKTRRDYFWLLQVSFKRITHKILRLVDTGYPTYNALNQTLCNYYRERILKKVGVTTHHSTKKLYDMHSVRSYHATEWTKLVNEYHLMGWTLELPNPSSTRARG